MRYINLRLLTYLLTYLRRLNECDLQAETAKAELEAKDKAEKLKYEAEDIYCCTIVISFGFESNFR